MKSWMAIPVIIAVVACASWGQTRTEDLSAARQERSLALGVNLVAWDDKLPEGGWERWSARPALAPGFSVDRMDSSGGVPAIKLSGAKKKYVLGGWRRTADRIEGGRAYRFYAEIEAKGVVSIRRNIICQIRWTGPDLGNEITPEYVNNYVKGLGYLVTLDETFIAPDGATGCEVSLLVQWAPTTELTFKKVTFETAKPAVARVVRMATVYWRPDGPSTPAKNVEAFSALIDILGPKRPDVILLPEASTTIGTGLSNFDSAQEMPGDAFFALAAKAKQYHCYIIYGAYEKVGDVVFNSAFIIARDGTLAGTYRKVQLPYGEVEGGLSPGEYFKTFDLDFGKVGILICHDTAFDEPARVEALDGAEVIFVPIWGGEMTQLKARAMDNGIYIVTSGYDVPCAVIDPAGEVRAMTWMEIGDGTTMAAVDLAKKLRRPWIGDWRNAVFKQRRTDAYLKLVED